MFHVYQRILQVLSIYNDTLCICGNHYFLGYSEYVTSAFSLRNVCGSMWLWRDSISREFLAVSHKGSYLAVSEKLPALGYDPSYTVISLTACITVSLYSFWSCTKTYQTKKYLENIRISLHFDVPWIDVNKSLVNELIKCWLVLRG